MSNKPKVILVLVATVILVASILVIALYLFKRDFENYYLQTMKNLNETEIKEAIKDNLTHAYNFTELFVWEHSSVDWVPIGEKFDRADDPLTILANRKGRCGEFSILYVSACLSLGYEARLVTSVRPISYFGLHVWAEVMYNGSWVHVDPTEQKWNNMSMYQSWWGEIGKDALIFAFEDGRMEEVTNNYK